MSQDLLAEMKIIHIIYTKKTLSGTRSGDRKECRRCIYASARNGWQVDRATSLRGRWALDAGAF